MLHIAQTGCRWRYIPGVVRTMDPGLVSQFHRWSRYGTCDILVQDPGLLIAPVAPVTTSSSALRAVDAPAQPHGRRWRGGSQVPRPRWWWLGRRRERGAALLGAAHRNVQ